MQPRSFAVRQKLRKPKKISKTKYYKLQVSAHVLRHGICNSSRLKNLHPASSIYTMAPSCLLPSAFKLVAVLPTRHKPSRPPFLRRGIWISCYVGTSGKSSSSDKKKFFASSMQQESWRQGQARPGQGQRLAEPSLPPPSPSPSIQNYHHLLQESWSRFASGTEGRGGEGRGWDGMG